MARQDERLDNKYKNAVENLKWQEVQLKLTEEHLASVKQEIKERKERVNNGFEFALDGEG